MLFYNVLHLKLCFFLHWLIEPCLIFSEALQSQALSESPKHHVLEAVVQEAFSVTTCIILQEFCSANLCIMSSQAKDLIKLPQPGTQLQKPLGRLCHESI